MPNNFCNLPRVHVHPSFSMRDLDNICQKHTCFNYFFDLVDAGGNYYPTVNCQIPELVILADCYDNYQIARGDSRRACRYGQ